MYILDLRQPHLWSINQMANDSFFVSSNTFHGLLNDTSIIISRISGEPSNCLVSHSKLFSTFWIDSLFKRSSTRDFFICNNYLSNLKPRSPSKNESECFFISSPFLSFVFKNFTWRKCHSKIVLLKLWWKQALAPALYSSSALALAAALSGFSSSSRWPCNRATRSFSKSPRVSDLISFSKSRLKI